MAVPPGLKLAWYGDDFTGASDTLATLAEAGLKALLFLDVPSAAQLQAAGPLDAVGIAGAARSMAPAAMHEALAPVARFFAHCGAPVLHYKCCSTFDSAAHIGSIGQAVATLAAALGNRPALIVGGQPSLGRYCAFGQLFASAGPQGPVYRIDRHPTMSRHPVTPMAEADLRRHLAAQGLAPITSLDVRDYEQPAADLDARLQAMLAPGTDDGAARAVLMDLVSEAQLPMIGRLLWQRAQAAPQLCVGASSVAQALLRHWGVGTGLARAGAIAPAKGPVLVLSGSLSALSARQVQAARSYERVPLDAVKLAGGDASYTHAVAATLVALLRGGRHVLAYTAASGGDEAPVSTSPDLALACGRLLRQVLESAPVSRLGVAGGDTSSLALQALAPTAMAWLGRPSAGIALCRLHATPAWLDGMEVMLKGGQMGSEDLFERLIGQA